MADDNTAPAVEVPNSAAPALPPAPAAPPTPKEPVTESSEPLKRERSGGRRSDIAAAFEKAENEAKLVKAKREAQAAPSDVKIDSGADNAIPAREKAVKAELPADAPVAAPAVTTEIKPESANKHEGFPLSWKKDLKESWASIPEPVRAEITRREQVIQRTLSDSAESRAAMREFQRVMSPYMEQIQKENGTPFTAISNVMHAAQTLKTGSPEQRAKVVAAMVRKYGVDIESLDKELASGLAPEFRTEDLVTRAIDSRMGPLNQMIARMQEAERRRVQQQEMQTVSAVEDFGREHPHFDSVRHVMADFIELAARNGQTMSLDEAYERAVWANPETRSAMQKGRELSSAGAANAQAEEARRKAASVAGSPAPASTRKQPGSLRETIEAAWDNHARS